MNRYVAPVAFIASLALLVGCARSAGTIEGSIDGDEVGAISEAVFGLVEFEASDEETIFVIAGTADDLCTHLTEQYVFLNKIVHPNATRNDVKNAAGDLADYINDNDLVGHWTFSLTAAADRQVDFQEENELDIDSSAGAGDDRMFFSATEQRREPAFDETDGYSSGEEIYSADEGSAAWSLDDDLTGVEVVGSASLRDAEGDSAGDVDFEINAEPCNSFADEYVDLLDNLYSNSCQYARDGECDEPGGFCPAGTDTTDCG